MDRPPLHVTNTPLQDVLWIVSDYLPSDPPPDDVHSWPIWETMAAHAEELILEATKAGMGGEPTSRLASMLGRFFAKKSLWPKAESFARLSVEIDEQMLGPEHPDVAFCLNNLAQVLNATNRLVEAEPLYRRALSIA